MSPNLLALDTSTPRAVVALATPQGVFHADSAVNPSARHGATLLPAIRDLLASAGRTLSDLEGYVVGLGPGSYTGLRVGLMAAKTLAHARGKGLAGFDSLGLIARNAPPDALRVAVIADAQRGDLYSAEFAREGEGSPLARVGQTRVIPFDHWAADLPDGTWVLGPAAASGRFLDHLPGTARLPEHPSAHAPDSGRLAELAAEVWETGHRENLWFVEPVYLRKSAAEEQWEKLGR